MNKFARASAKLPDKVNIFHRVSESTIMRHDYKICVSN